MQKHRNEQLMQKYLPKCMFKKYLEYTTVILTELWLCVRNELYTCTSAWNWF